MRTILRKSEGVRSDGTTKWFGLVLEEKFHVTDGKGTLYPQKMQFVTQGTYDAVAEKQEIEVAE
jgi:hypothetical protein